MMIIKEITRGFGMASCSRQIEGKVRVDFVASGSRGKCLRCAAEQDADLGEGGTENSTPHGLVTNFKSRVGIFKFIFPI